MKRIVFKAALIDIYDQGHVFMKSIWSLSLHDFREATAADTSTPSCGAAAVVTASMGVALILMALRISETKSADLNRAKLIDTIETLKESLGRYADADISAFERYLDAARLPEDSIQQARKREHQVQEAMQEATNVPLETAALCNDILRQAKEVIPLTAANVLSDIVSGSLIVHGALSAVLLNVDMDVKSLKAADKRRESQSARETLQQQADQHLLSIRQAWHNR
jgi:formiminotetrahydrofolate cyclodeaminase